MTIDSDIFLPRPAAMLWLLDTLIADALLGSRQTWFLKHPTQQAARHTVDTEEADCDAQAPAEAFDATSTSTCKTRSESERSQVASTSQHARYRWPLGGSIAKGRPVIGWTVVACLQLES